MSVITPIKKRDYLIEDISQWPIAKLYEDRDALVDAVRTESLDAIKIKHGHDLEEVIARTIYLEPKRLQETPWRVDLRSEPRFWKKMKADLLKLKVEGVTEKEKQAGLEAILHTIVDRYTEEIVGGFKESTVRFARKFLVRFFRLLMNTSNIFKSREIKDKELHDKIQMYGDLDRISGLFNEGIVVLVPTHFSNLDSLLIAYSLDEIAGLPSFSYGAGLNLFNSEVVAYFMNRLGTYRIDRRKRNPLYLETLLSFSRTSMLRGTNSLFFPGGTRSRSGEMESKLKLGLLQTLIETQRRLIQKGSKQKIFVVPVVIGYNVVLEARSLIHQSLSRSEEEKFLASKIQTLTLRQILKFAWNYFRQNSEITMSFGSVTDVLGNKVADNGISVDKWNREIKLDEYFMSDGIVEANPQREKVYTRRLGRHIIDSYHKYNIVLSSHLISYVAFHMLRAQHADKSTIDFLNLKSIDDRIDYKEFKQAVQRFVKYLVIQEEQGELLIEPEIKKKFKKMLKKAIDLLGAFHNTKVLVHDKESSTIYTEDHKLLYYYSNRLSSYQFNHRIFLPSASDKVS